MGFTCEETQTVRRCLLASSRGIPTVSTTWLSASLNRNFVVPSFAFTCNEQDHMPCLGSWHLGWPLICAL